MDIRAEITVAVLELEHIRLQLMRCADRPNDELRRRIAERLTQVRGRVARLITVITTEGGNRESGREQ